MKILALTPALYDTAPGQRYRIEQWARHLEKDGFQFTFVPFEDARLHRVIYARGQLSRKAALMSAALVRRLKTLGTAGRYDVVFLVREAAMIGPALIERILAQLRVPVVYDFDDPVWLPYRSPNNGLLSRLKWPSKTATICRLATRVVVGNRLLAQWARAHAAEVDVVPSTIDLRQYPPKPAARIGQPLTLGWTGSHSTLPFLQLLRDPLEKLATRHPFRLLVISHSDSYQADSTSFDVVAKRWNSATEATDLHQMDIGLGPFPDTGWTPWRCHGKVLQYMAAGIPCVASRIGILPEYIQDGVNGFLASSQREWIDKLTLLAADIGLRRQIGLAARQTIQQRYCVDVWLPRLREILTAAAMARRPSQTSRAPLSRHAGRESKCHC